MSAEEKILLLGDQLEEAREMGQAMYCESQTLQSIFELLYFDFANLTGKPIPENLESLSPLEQIYQLQSIFSTLPDLANSLNPIQGEDTDVQNPDTTKISDFTDTLDADNDGQNSDLCPKVDEEIIVTEFGCSEIPQKNHLLDFDEVSSFSQLSPQISEIIQEFDTITRLQKLIKPMKPYLLNYREIRGSDLDPHYIQNSPFVLPFRQQDDQFVENHVFSHAQERIGKLYQEAQDALDTIKKFRTRKQENYTRFKQQFTLETGPIKSKIQTKIDDRYDQIASTIEQKDRAYEMIFKSMAPCLSVPFALMKEKRDKIIEQECKENHELHLSNSALFSEAYHQSIRQAIIPSTAALLQEELEVLPRFERDLDALTQIFDLPKVHQFCDRLTEATNQLAEAVFEKDRQEKGKPPQLSFDELRAKFDELDDTCHQEIEKIVDTRGKIDTLLYHRHHQRYDFTQTAEQCAEVPADLNERFLCSICKQRISNVMITKCSHIFCFKCLTKFDFCPSCGEHFTMKELVLMK